MRYGPGRWGVGRWERGIGRLFLVTGRSANTGAAGNEVLGSLWNPSSDRSVWVVEFSWATPVSIATLDPLRLCRTTTAGTTPGSTVTPDVDNDFMRELAPVTGVRLDLANFTTEPTLATPELFRLGFPTSSAQHSMTWRFHGLRIPPGTGLALATTGAIGATGSDMTFMFYE